MGTRKTRDLPARLEKLLQMHVGIGERRRGEDASPVPEHRGARSGGAEKTGWPRARNRPSGLMSGRWKRSTACGYCLTRHYPKNKLARVLRFSAADLQRVM
jgi:hypothetical protein